MQSDDSDTIQLSETVKSIDMSSSSMLLTTLRFWRIFSRNMLKSWQSWESWDENQDVQSSVYRGGRRRGGRGGRGRRGVKSVDGAAVGSKVKVRKSILS